MLFFRFSGPSLFPFHFPFFPKDIYYLLSLWITLTVKNFKGRYATLARLRAKPSSLFKIRNKKNNPRFFQKQPKFQTSPKAPVQGGMALT